MIIRDDLFQMLRAVGADSGLVYVSVPITSGRRHFEYRDRHAGAEPDLDRWCAEVKQPNTEQAEVYAARVRERSPGSIVLNPAVLEKPGWSQDDYNAMWLEVIQHIATTVVATPEWAWSKGARLEVGAAVFHGKPVVDIDGNPLTTTALESQAAQAHDELAAMGWDADAVVEELPQFKADHPDLRESAQAQIFAWLVAERRYQIGKFGTELDDHHTREGLGPDQWWRRQLDNYLHRAFVLGLDLPVGRQALAKFVATAAGLLESVVRTHGDLPPAGVPSGEVDPTNAGRADHSAA